MYEVNDELQELNLVSLPEQSNLAKIMGYFSSVQPFSYVLPINDI